MTKLKQTIFFEHFDWDSLKEFKLTPPCIPETLNLSKYQSNTLTTFEKALFTEQTNARRRDSNNMLSRESPKGFISNWADEF